MAKNAKENKPEEKRTEDKENLPESENDSVNISLEDLEDLLDKLKKDYDLDGKNVKIVRIEKRKLTLKERIISIVFTYLFDFILILSLFGYLGFREKNFLWILLFSLMFSTVEILLRTLMMRYFAKIMYLSLGLASIPITILSFIVTVLPFKEIAHDDNLVLFFIIFLVLRVITKMLLMRKNREKFYERIKGGK